MLGHLATQVQDANDALECFFGLVGIFRQHRQDVEFTVLILHQDAKRNAVDLCLLSAAPSVLFGVGWPRILTTPFTGAAPHPGKASGRRGPFGIFTCGRILFQVLKDLEHGRLDRTVDLGQVQLVTGYAAVRSCGHADLEDDHDQHKKNEQRQHERRATLLRIGPRQTRLSCM